MLTELEEQLDKMMRRDRFAAERELGRLHRAGAAGDHPRALRIRERIEASVELRRQRSQNLPQLVYDVELPILQHRQEIIEGLRAHQVIIVAGETGSGKSTQLPKFCLEAGFGLGGLIGHTQPRRIAARSVASRIAEELGQPLGRAVGFKIRFDDQTDAATYIKLMTDGILLSETRSDRFLDQYEVLILDEAHERSLNIDFLLAFLHRLRNKRRDLRLIVTSATIDAERFAEHFGDDNRAAPIFRVAGRTYPVDVRYRPLPAESDDSSAWLEPLVAALHEVTAEDRGDVLAFLPTERDIREAAQRLRGEKWPGDGQARTEILPLYARLSGPEQDRIFHPGTARRIVLATNVAESSLTVPRIRYVVDLGTARISRYSPKSKVQRLPIEAISRASADQRKGRCGRIAPGICVRLYAQDDYETREPYSTPEIRRTNLASVILQAKTLRLGAIDAIPFVDPPRPEAIRDGYKTLFEIGAIDNRQELTEIGRRLAELPVDPRIGRMILAAVDERCLADVLIIAAVLETQDPRLRPLEKQQAADQQHERFRDEKSDFVSLLKVWDHFQHLRENLSRTQLRKACEQQFLSLARLHEWSEIHRQLRQLTGEHKLRGGGRSHDYDAIHRALLSGLLSGVAWKTAEHEYTGAGGLKFHLWPGSGVMAHKPAWIVVAELVETSRRFGRTVAAIQPQWLEPLAQHLVRRSYGDPHWHRKAAAVMALERVTLFGLPVVQNRRVAYGAIDPRLSRQLFIEHGLVGEEMDCADAFFVHNRALRQEITDLSHKTRERQYLLDEYSLYRCYDQRLPESVVDLAGLRRWLKQTAKSRPDPLHFTREDLIGQPFELDPQTAFPDKVAVGSLELPVRYQFTPGDASDGITLTVPLEGLNQISEAHLDWGVPGQLEERLLALIRSLPKEIRRCFVPAPDTARRIAQELPFGQGLFLPVVAEQLCRLAGEAISISDFQLEKLPAHLRTNIEVVDAQGNLQAAGRDLREIRQKLGRCGARAEVIAEDSDWHRDGLVTWDFEQLPEQIAISRGGLSVVAFPTLIDATDSAQLRLLDSLPAADIALRGGARRLYLLAQRKALRSQTRWLPDWQQTTLHAASLLTSAELEEQVQALIADQAFLKENHLPRTRAEFERRLADAGSRIALGTQEVAELVGPLFQAYHKMRLAQEKLRGGKWKASSQDIDEQLSDLLGTGFLTTTPWSWLVHLPRYLQAIVYRIEKLAAGGQAREEASIRELARLRAGLAELLAADPHRRFQAQAIECRWLFEELRVSLFAQPLGTSTKVSPQRLEKQLQSIASV